MTPATPFAPPPPGGRRTRRSGGRSALLAALALPVAACDAAPPAADSPAVVIAPEGSTNSPFAVSGVIRLGTGECNGGTATLRRIMNSPVSNDFVWKPQNTTSAMVQATLGTTAADNSRPYTSTLNSGIDWKAKHGVWDSRPGPELKYGGSSVHGSSRWFSYDAGVLDDPSGDPPSVSWPLPHTNPTDAADLTSVRLQIEMPWHFASCSAEGCQDDIVSLRIVFGHYPLASSAFSASSCYGAGNNASNSQPCASLTAGQGPEHVNGFIRSYVKNDGTLIASGDGNGSVEKQRLEAELLVAPNEAYTVEIRAQLRNGSLYEQTQTFPATSFVPCGTTLLKPSDGSCAACAIAPYAQAIRGTVHLDIPPVATETVSATQYAATFQPDDDDVPQIGVGASGTTLWRTAPGGNASSAYSYDVPAGRYSLLYREYTSNDSKKREGHVDLAWSDRPASPISGFPATYRFPLSGLDGCAPDVCPTTGLDAAGALYVGPGETHVVNLTGVVSYLRGSVTLSNACNLTDAIIESGAAETLGVGSADGPDFTDENGTSRPRVTGNYGAFARGLFYGSQAPDATSQGHYEIAATAGSWEEEAYRLRLLSDPDDIDATLSVWPNNPVQVALGAAPRGSEQSIAAPRDLPITKIAIQVQVADSQTQQLRKPRVGLGSDASDRIAYKDSNGNVLGYYVATARDWSDDDGDPTSETFQVIAMANSTFDIVVMAEFRDCALVNCNDPEANWEQAPFNTTQVTLSGSCDQCLMPDNTFLADTDDNPDVTVADDAIDLPAGQASTTITGSITDDTPTQWTLLDGAGQPVTSGSLNAGGGGFAAPVSGLTEGMNTYTLEVTDCLQHTTTYPITITVAAPLCPAADTPDMCEADNSGVVPGSAFWIDLVGPNGEPGSLLCTVASDGAAPVCNPDAPNAFNTSAAQCGD